MMRLQGKLKQAVFILFFTLVLSTPLAFADAGDDDRGLEDNRTFHVSRGVDLVSTLKFDYGKPNIVIKSVYPQLASETDHEGINNFNSYVLAIVQNEINQFRKKVKDLSFAQKDLPRSKITNKLYIDYNTSFLRTKHNHIISIRFTIQGFITGIPRAFHLHRVINYKLDTSEEIDLSDLFKTDANYLHVLSEYTSNVLNNKHQPDKQLIAEGTASIPENYQIWNIKPTGLLITFEESKVAPYIQGAQTIFVPYSALKKVIAPDSPIAYCIKHKKRCLNTSVLTGGFIDEG